MKKLSIVALLSLAFVSLTYTSDSSNTSTRASGGGGNGQRRQATQTTTNQPTATLATTSVVPAAEPTGLATLQSNTQGRITANHISKHEAYKVIAADLKKAMEEAGYSFEEKIIKTKGEFTFKRHESSDPTKQNFDRPTHIFTRENPSDKSQSWDNLIQLRWLEIVKRLSERPGNSVDRQKKLAELGYRIELLNKTDFAPEQKPEQNFITVQQAVKKYSRRMQGFLHAHFTTTTVTQSQVDEYAANIALPFDDACKEAGVDPQNNTLVRKRFATDSDPKAVDLEQTQIQPDEGVVPADITAFVTHVGKLKPAFIEKRFTNLIPQSSCTENQEYPGGNYFKDEKTGNPIKFSDVSADRISRDEARKIGCNQAIAEISNGLLNDLTTIKDNLPLELAKVSEQITSLQADLKTKKEHAFLYPNEIKELEAKLAESKRQFASLTAQVEAAKIARWLQKGVIIQLAVNHGGFKIFNLPPTITMNAWTQSKATQNEETANQVLLSVAKSIIQEQKKADEEKRTAYLALIQEHSQALSKNEKTQLKDGKSYDFNGTRINIDRINDGYSNPQEQKSLSLLEAAVMAKRSYENTARLLLPDSEFQKFSRAERNEKLNLLNKMNSTAIAQPSS